MSRGQAQLGAAGLGRGGAALREGALVREEARGGQDQAHQGLWSLS